MTTIAGHETSACRLPPRARDPNKPLPPHPNAIDAAIHIAAGVMPDRSARHRTRPEHDVVEVVNAHGRHFVRGMFNMDGWVDNAVVEQRLIAGMAGFAATLAMALAAVGLFGLIVYSVSSRVREIGARMSIAPRRVKRCGCSFVKVWPSRFLAVLIGVPLASVRRRSFAPNATASPQPIRGRSPAPPRSSSRQRRWRRGYRPAGRLASSQATRCEPNRLVTDSSRGESGDSSTRRVSSMSRPNPDPSDGGGQLLAQLDAPLIERVDSPHRAHGEHACS